MKINQQKIKKQKRQSRQARIRAKLVGTTDRPRLSVYRSLKHISAQLIDDSQGKTLLAATDRELKRGGQAEKPTARAFKVGELLAQKAVERKISRVVFDRSGYKYHGAVKALADGARQAGLKF